MTEQKEITLSLLLNHRNAEGYFSKFAGSIIG